MKTNNIKTRYCILGILTLIVLVTGCASPTGLVEASETPEPTQTKLPPTSTATEIPPTLTNTPRPTLTSSPTELPTSTSTETPTSTPEPAVLAFEVDAVCMMGASYGHIVDHYVSPGTEYPLLGQLQDHSWWLVEAPDGPACWVDEAVASVRGDIETLPVVTPPPFPSITPTATPVTPGIYYILLMEDTGAPFGCGDSLIKYYPGVWVKGDMEDDIKGALNALFANHNQYVNGLFNPMYKSDLKAKDVEMVENDVVVQLAGTLVRPKTACESQQMHDQVWYTVSQFSPTRAVIYLNRALLGDLLVVAK